MPPLRKWMRKGRLLGADTAPRLLSLEGENQISAPLTPAECLCTAHTLPGPTRQQQGPSSSEMDRAGPCGLLGMEVPPGILSVGWRLQASRTFSEFQSAGSHSWKSKRVPEKHLFLLYWLCQSLWLCGSQQTVENSERNGNTRPPDLPPEKFVCRSGSNS